MALVFRRGLFQGHRQLSGILKFQVKHLKHSVVFGREDESADIKENLLPEAINQKRVEQFMANLDNDPIHLARKEAIEVMIEDWRFQNKPMPEVIKDKDWYMLLTEKYAHEKTVLSYLHFLANIEKTKMRRKVKKEKKIKLLKENEPDFEENYPQFSIHHPTRDRCEMFWNRLQAWKSDIPIVVDLNFPEADKRNQITASVQFERLFSQNIKHVQPLQVHMTSVCDNFRMLSNHESSNSLPVFFHEDHFMDKFPHEQLVYLSKDGQPMREFDKDKIYVIGGVVDKPMIPRLTSSLAKTYGIPCRSLPLDSYVKVAQSTRKDLNIDVVFNIIQNMYLTHNWQDAFETSFSHTSRYRLLNDEERNQIPKKKFFNNHSSVKKFWRN